ncbi:hypothetical protein GGI15_001132 [Coemansia interrupta]|uniref:Uncharacterized protein n=1 Tax=Coemansia interrupta TaxID=1126814 RepID=A0A9W8HIL3_9FUNG|nr:hypothetical protein GGI15_001132 [Coemansia interrupta]
MSSAINRKSNRTRAPSASGGRGSSWLRNNWTESETREVMEILVAEFIANDYSTAAYSKSHAPDARFDGLSFERPPRELYNKVQNLRQRFFTPHSYLLRWAAPNADPRSLKRAEKCLMNSKTRDSIHGIFACFAPEEAARCGINLDSGVVITGPSATTGAAVAGGMFAFSSSGAGSSELGHTMLLSGSAADANASANRGGAAGSTSVKSVNYYCDIFRRQAPELWETSVVAYKQFLSNRELQSASAPSAETEGEQSDIGVSSSSRRRIRNQHQNHNAGNALDLDSDLAQSMLGSPPLSLASSSMQTPSSALMTDFGSDFYSDSADDSSHEHLQLMAVVGHSWHKFLSLRSRWMSLGLEYASKEDWQRKEAGFLAHHLLTLIPDFACDPTSLIPLTLVSQFVGSFDATNIEMAVSRARTASTVTLATLVDGLLAIMDHIESKDPYTVVSLCWLTDRATHSRVSLALLVSHGSSSQRFGVFPHNDTMFARMVAGSEGMWHEYSGLLTMQSMLATPHQMPEDGSAGRTAFAYSQSGIRYTFFARLRGHFFEMTRDEDWAPTLKPAIPRLVWNPMFIGRDMLLSIMHSDTEKILTGMVELFGLRTFCHGFFDGITGSVQQQKAVAAPSLPSNPRRTSDDPNFGSARRRNPSTSSRMRRNRISTGAIPTLGASGGSNSGGASPYRRPQNAVSSSMLSSQLSAGGGPSTSIVAAAAAAAAAARTLSHQSSRGSLNGVGLGLLGQAQNSNSNSSTNIAAFAVSASGTHQNMSIISPQTHSYNSFPSSVDISAMSASLPNSPFFGLQFDNVGQHSIDRHHQQQQHQHQHHTPLMLQGHGNNAVGGGMPHDSMQLFPSLNDAAFLTAAAVTTPNAGFLQDPLLAGGNASDRNSVSSINSNDDRMMSSLPTTTAAMAVSSAIDTGSLFASTAIANPSSFWDLSGTGLQQQMQQASLNTPVTSTINVPSGTLSSIGSPSAHAVVAAAAAAAAAMGMTGPGIGGVSGGPSSAASSASSTSTSVAIYPPPSTGSTAMPVWDDVSAQSLSNVLGSPDMLMQFAQPSPTPTLTQYNLSAQPTPAIETYSAPPLNNQFEAFAQTLASTAASISASIAAVVGGQTDITLAMVNGSNDAGKVSSSMAAYFGTPGSTHESPFAHELGVPNSQNVVQSAGSMSGSQHSPTQQQQPPFGMDPMSLYPTEQE